MLPASYLIFDLILGIKESYKGMVSGERKNRQEELSVHSLIDQDSSLIPLLVRLIEIWVWENLKCSKAYYIRLSLF